MIIEIIESTYPMSMEKLFSRKLVSGARKVGDCFTQGSRKGRNQDNFERASLTEDSEGNNAPAKIVKLLLLGCLFL